MIQQGYPLLLRTPAAAHREYSSPCPRDVPYYKLVLPPLQQIDARIARLRKPSAPKDGIGVAYATANTIGPVADPSAHLPSSRRSQIADCMGFQTAQDAQLGSNAVCNYSRRLTGTNVPQSFTKSENRCVNAEHMICVISWEAVIHHAQLL
jgi:hypothetical protein